MRIATWNVNSVNARLETVLRWFEAAQPDVACLQEIKCVDEKFPAEAFERLGYNVAVHGQKTYNGVALLSKTPLEDVRRGLPGRRRGRPRPLHRGGDLGAAAGAGGLASTCPTAIRSAPRSSPTSCLDGPAERATPRAC